MAQLSHPNIVMCAGARMSDQSDNIYIVMELMALGDLRGYLLNAYVMYYWRSTYMILSLLSCPRRGEVGRGGGVLLPFPTV